MATSLKPTRKVGTTGVTGAAVLLIVYIAGLFGADVPAEAAAALVLLISWAAGYLIPEKRTIPAGDGEHRAGGTGL